MGRAQIFAFLSRSNLDKILGLSFGLDSNLTNEPKILEKPDPGMHKSNYNQPSDILLICLNLSIINSLT